MKTTYIRSILAALFGKRYRELPFGTRREQVQAALTELNATKCGETGTPAFELNVECFRVGRQKLRVSTEDELFVSLFGSRALVDHVYEKITASATAKGNENAHDDQRSAQRKGQT